MKADEHFCKLAVQLGYASDEQVRAVLAEKAQLTAQGRAIQVGALLVDRGVLTREQAGTVAQRQRQDKRDLLCPGCGATFTVLGLPAGKTLPCKHCKTALVDAAGDVGPAPVSSSVDIPSLEMPAAPAPNAELPTRLPGPMVAAQQAQQAPQATIGSDTGWAQDAQATSPGSWAQGAVPTSATPIPTLEPPGGAPARTLPATGSSPTLSQGSGPHVMPIAPDTDALIGCTLAGKFLLQRKLGQGGMGAVYLAQQLNLDRLCAIKILPHQLASDPVLVQRFLQEARACAALDAPNVVRVHDVDNDSGYYYLAMEFVEGEPVDVLIKRHGKIPWKKSVDIARQAALGLGEAHGKGIIHRDIKPANLMMTHDRRVKVMDFGLARLRSTDSHLTQSQQILGTPHYMSPEQARGETCDRRTDIYSLGASLYYMATGRTPFEAPAPTMLLLKVLDEEPTPAHELAPKVPEALAVIIAKMMAKSPDDRYQDTAELVADLDRLTGGQQIAARPPAPTRKRRPSAVARSGARVESTIPKHYLAAGGVAALALLLLLVALFSGGDGGALEALTRLRETVADDSVALEDRILACTRFVSDFPSATDEQQMEVDQLKRALKAELKTRKKSERALSDLVDRIGALLRNDEAEKAERELAAFRTRYPALRDRTRDLGAMVTRALARAGDGSGSTGLPVPPGASKVIAEFARLLASEAFDAARRHYEQHYSGADIEDQARLAQLRDEALMAIEQGYRRALEKRDWGGADRAIAFARALGANRWRVKAWDDELASRRGGAGSHGAGSHGAGSHGGALGAVDRAVRGNRTAAGIEAARTLLAQVRRDRPADWKPVEGAIVRLFLRAMAEGRDEREAVGRIAEDLHGIAGDRAPYLALVGGAALRLDATRPGRAISPAEVKAARLCAAALEGGVPIPESLQIQLDLHSAQDWMRGKGIPSVLVERDGRRHACLQTHRGRGEYHMIVLVDPSPFGERPPFVIEERRVVRIHEGRALRSADEAKRALQNLEADGSLLAIVQLTLTCKMQMIFATAPGPGGGGSGRRGGGMRGDGSGRGGGMRGDRGGGRRGGGMRGDGSGRGPGGRGPGGGGPGGGGPGAEGDGDEWQACIELGDKIMRARLRKAPRLEPTRVLAMLAIGARLVKTDGDPNMAQLAQIYDKLVTRDRGWSGVLQEIARDLGADKVNRTALRRGPPGGGSGRRGPGGDR